MTTSRSKRADVELLEALASHAAMALRSSQLLDRLRRRSRRRTIRPCTTRSTGLGNRTLFAEQIEAALDRREGDSVVAVMLMDLDRFKDVNDTLGHHTGDVVLQQIADSAHPAPSETTARWHGSAVTSSRSSSRRIEPGACRGRGRAMSWPAGRPVRSSKASGSRCGPASAWRSLRTTDRTGRRCSAEPTSPCTTPRPKQRDRGVSTGPRPAQHAPPGAHQRDAPRPRDVALELHYQPKAEIFSGRVSGVEALVRWTHPALRDDPAERLHPLGGAVRPDSSADALGARHRAAPALHLATRGPRSDGGREPVGPQRVRRRAGRTARLPADQNPCPAGRP